MDGSKGNQKRGKRGKYKVHEDPTNPENLDFELNPQTVIWRARNKRKKKEERPNYEDDPILAVNNDDDDPVISNDPENDDYETDTDTDADTDSLDLDEDKITELSDEETPEAEGAGAAENSEENHEWDEEEATLRLTAGVEGGETPKYNYTEIEYDILKLFVAGESKSTLQGTLDIVNKILPEGEKMAAKADAFLRSLDQKVPPIEVTRHFYYKCCGKSSADDASKPRGTDGDPFCPNCEKQGVPFYELDLAQQIRNLFECGYLGSKMVRGRVEGREFRRVNDGLPPDGREALDKTITAGPYDLSLIMNTDGVRISKNGLNSECWPVLFHVAEIPPEIRSQTILFGGVWVADSKPVMNVYLKPIVGQIRRMYRHGLKWTNPATKKEEVSRVKVPVISADAPGRAELLNIKYFSGQSCCNSCETTYEPFENQNTGKMTGKAFGYKEGTPLRTDKSIRQDGATAEKLNATKRTKKPLAYNGLKGQTIIRFLPLIDLSKAVVPEAMHAYFLGVFKLLMLAFFCTVGEPFSLTQEQIDKINDALADLRVPSFIHRPPRRIEELKNFKASEFLFWVFFFILPLLSGVLPQVYFDHLLLFCKSMYILCKKDNTDRERELRLAEEMLTRFVQEMEVLYGPSYMPYNVHQLVHAPQMVRDFGYLPETWAFPFESFNGIIAKSVHGTKHFGAEVSNRLRHIAKLTPLRSKYESEGRRKFVYKPTDICPPAQAKLTEAEKNILVANNVNIDRVVIYKKVIIKGVQFTSLLWQEGKNNDYTVEMKTKETHSKLFGVVKFFFLSDQKLYAFVRLLGIDDESKFFTNGKYVIDHIVPIVQTRFDVLIDFDDVTVFRHVIPIGNSYVGLQPYPMKKNL